jgi:cysteine-rich repeat protein
MARPTLLASLALAALCAAPAQANLALAPSDAGAGFGLAVAIGDPGVAVGAETRAPDFQGGAYVFRFDGTSWVEAQILTAPDAADDERFGSAVGADGDVLVVASRGREVPVNSGSVYVHRFDGAQYVLEQQLDSPDGGAWFPGEIAVSGDLLAVAAPTVSPRAVHVFSWSGSAWGFVQTLTSSVGSDDYAGDVALSGDVLVVGARADDDGDGSSNFGAAHVYRWNGGGFDLEQTLRAPDRSANDLFGNAVAVGGDLVTVGAFLDDPIGSASGSAYVFRRSGSSWAFEQKLVAPAYDAIRFGETVGVGDGFVAVGRIQRSQIFVFVESGGSWILDRTLEGQNGVDNLGTSLATSRALLLSGVTVGPSVRLFELGSCGDGALDAGEECDDANETEGDGCSPFCFAEECGNGLDDDGDGVADAADPGCSGASDPWEGSLTAVCDDGEDSDGDGFVDVPDDPGCRTPLSLKENPQCQDGLNNDAKPGIDFDGGASVNGGVPIAAPDPQCGAPWRDLEASTSCGLGFELAPALALVALLRRRRAPQAPTSQISLSG